MEEGHARAITRELRRIDLTNAATKGDVVALRQEMQELRAEMQQVRSDLENLIHQQMSSFTVRICFLLMAQAGLVTALIKLL